MIIQRMHISMRLPTQNHLGTTITLRLEQHRIHVAMRLDTRRQRLQRRGTANLAAIHRYRAVQRHVLRLERRHRHPAPGQHTAQPRHHRALARIGGGALNHQRCHALYTQKNFTLTLKSFCRLPLWQAPDAGPNETAQRARQWSPQHRKEHHMSVINTNITSMIGQSNLTKSQNALQTSMERLSSGLRINSAKDDAAGQAIANRMTAQITGLAQAQRNANDGISIAQTAEGSLNQVNDNLQRIRELTVQSANGTNSADDLKSIQEEIDQRLEEINRISDETSFNGVNVLKENKALSIQVGANDNETITVNLEQINQETLGLTNFTVGGLSRAITSVSHEVDGVTSTT